MSKKEIIFWTIWFIIICPIMLAFYFYERPAPMIYTDGFVSNFDDRTDNEIREIDKNY